jgi:hypothetical protein
MISEHDARRLEEMIATSACPLSPRRQKGTPPEVDAVWPASSLWVELYDTRRRRMKRQITTPASLRPTARA